MAEQKGDDSKALGRVLLVLALIAGFTGLFLPVKGYIEHQVEQDKLYKELEHRMTVMETRMEVYQAWPPPVTK